MVTENSRDTIILADFDGHRSYVSAATSTISGWSTEELLQQNSFELLHPLDVEKVQDAIKELRSTNGSAVVECRIQKKSGDYTWVESSLRVVHDRRTGAPTGLLNLVRDIAERKQAEQRLQDAYNAVEALAVTDALTGLANRRRFDQCLTTEWRRSMRERTPLSVLMIDADLFKKYNDTYGHPRGDSCLKQIAEAALDVVSRPGDLVARFGGEEFTVVLPNTDNEGAYRVGKEICESMRNRRLPHSGNPFGIMTISVGCATMVPKLGQHAPDLLEMADQALYQAKHNGRNQVSNGNAPAAAGEEALTEAVPAVPGETTA
jgi:diguanylate cyclase (GGDEF)-like protein/PAS domain S-box-containing protein